MITRSALEDDIARTHDLISWEGTWIVREFLQTTDDPGRIEFDDAEAADIRAYADEWVDEWAARTDEDPQT